MGRGVDQTVADSPMIRTLIFLHIPSTGAKRPIIGMGCTLFPPMHGRMDGLADQYDSSKASHLDFPPVRRHGRMGGVIDSIFAALEYALEQGCGECVCIRAIKKSV